MLLQPYGQMDQEAKDALAQAKKITDAAELERKSEQKTAEAGGIRDQQLAQFRALSPSKGGTNLAGL
jgi:hypothetical protein